MHNASIPGLAVLLIAILLLTCNEVAQPSPRLKSKVFVIGLSKTGTTSFGNALEVLGYKKLGWKDIRSRHLVHCYVNDDLGPVIEQTKYYDAFEDLPWARLYRQMSELYPDSKFILSLRKDDETWSNSMRRHVKRGRWLPYTHFYGADTWEGNEATILQSYQNHTQNVREFFKDKPHRYLELKIDDGDANWAPLCRFLECPGGITPSQSFPKKNTAAHWHDGNGILAWLHWFWGWTLARLEEHTAYWFYERREPSVRAILSLIWRTVDLIDQACSEIYYKVAVLNLE
jgi:hypothetical protein